MVSARQVITVDAAGVISGLQVKKGRGVDLRSLGKATIVRASEIEWDEGKQAWQVVIRDAPGMEAIKGVAVTYRMAEVAGVDKLARDMMLEDRMNAVTESVDLPLTFPDYEDAVAFEIAFLDAHRLAGRF